LLLFHFEEELSKVEINKVCLSLLLVVVLVIVIKEVDEQKLREDLELIISSLAIVASIVEEIREQIVIVVSIHLLEKTQRVYSQLERFIDEASLGSGCLLFGQASQHVNRYLVEGDVTFLLLVT
jgi:hypothetical protein